MNLTGWLITIGGVIPLLVIVVGSIVFAARARSCAALGLVLGAVGQFVMAIVLPIYRLVIYRELVKSGEYEILQAVDITVSVLTILAALWFAVFLLVVLFGKSRAKGASSAPQPQPGPQPQPAFTQAPPPPAPMQAPPPPAPTQAPPPPPGV
ncbi:MAG: hypothetical protein Q7J82_09210 [Coriobacteriia bacterium]|nr:hypothetical protein [Coriobacteriia bacterium]